MKYRTRTIQQHTLTLDDSTDVDLEFAPSDEDHIFVHQVQDKMVVAYLTRDDYSENPLTSSDCQGNIYLSSDRNCIWNNPDKVRSTLGLGGDLPDIEQEFSLDGVAVTLKDLAVDKYLASRDIIGIIDAYFEDTDTEFDEGETYEMAYQSEFTSIRQWAYDLDDVEELAYELYAEHWQKMAGPFVVPIRYQGIGGGCYTAYTNTTGWDGDYDDLPDGVWVADEGAVENVMWAYKELLDLRFSEFVTKKTSQGKYYGFWQGVYKVRGGTQKLYHGWSEALSYEILRVHPEIAPEVHEKAKNYAAGVLKKVESWMNGEVYGCVTEYFTKNGDWEQTNSESCWGYVGEKYALEALKGEWFDPAVKLMEK